MFALEMDVNWINFINGDDDAFSLIYEKYFNGLFAYGYKLGFSKSICEDAIHDVFYKLFASRKNLMHISNVEFYLLSSLKNRLFDIYNQEKPVSRLEDAFYMTDNDSIIESIITKETEKTINTKINELLNKLTPKQRKVIYYRYVHNLKYNEIATILDLSPNSVKKIIQRAFKTMRSNTDNSVNPFFL